MRRKRFLVALQAEVGGFSKFNYESALLICKKLGREQTHCPLARLRERKEGGPFRACSGALYEGL